MSEHSHSAHAVSKMSINYVHFKCSFFNAHREAIIIITLMPFFTPQRSTKSAHQIVFHTFD